METLQITGFISSTLLSETLSLYQIPLSPLSPQASNWPVSAVNTIKQLGRRVDGTMKMLSEKSVFVCLPADHLTARDKTRLWEDLEAAETERISHLEEATVRNRERLSFTAP